MHSKSLQSCLNLHNPMDGSQQVPLSTGSSGLEWVAMTLGNLVAKTCDLALSNDFFKMISKA